MPMASAKSGRSAIHQLRQAW